MTKARHGSQARSWKGKRVFAVLKHQWDEMQRQQERKNTQMCGNLASALVSQGNQQHSCKRERMRQVLVSSLVTGLGSFGAGFMMGYGLKKVIRFIIIAVRAIAGVFFIALALMQKHGYISNIKWDAMAKDLYTSANTTLTNFHMSNIHEAVSYLGIPVTGGLGLGLISGFLKG